MRGLWVERVEALLRSHGIEVGSLSYCAFYSNIRARGRISFALFEQRAARPRFVASISRTSAGRRALEQEMRTYHHCRKNNEVLKRQFERLYHFDDDFAFVVDEFFEGTPLHLLLTDRSACRRAIDWLVDFQSSWTGAPWCRSDYLEELDDAMRLAVRCYQPTEAVKKAVARVRATIAAATDFALSKTMVHGDLTPSNMIVGRDRVAVVDWEWLAREGCPLHDFWMLLVAICAGLCGRRDLEEDSAATAAILTGRSPHSRWVAELARYYLAKTGFPAELVCTYGVLRLLHYINRGDAEEPYYPRLSPILLNRLGEDFDAFLRFID